MVFAGRPANYADYRGAGGSAAMVFSVPKAKGLASRTGLLASCCRRIVLGYRVGRFSAFGPRLIVAMVLVRVNPLCIFGSGDAAVK